MHIFISYSKQDTRDLALRLDRELEAIDGITCWVDRDLRVTQDWAVQIQDQIDRCDLMLVLLSPDVNRRTTPVSFVLREISYAQSIPTPILPVIAQPTRVPVQLAGIQYIDLTRDLEIGMQQIIAEVCHIAGIEIPGAKPQFRLPDPFAWIDIPAGKVEIEGHGAFEVPAFQISKYPITVAQYKLFMDDGGYTNNQWWTEAGWKMREEKGWTQPRYWGEEEYKEFFQPDHPIIGVSWYESLAYCYWLSAKTGDHILLPTEQQWQRAAQGNDGRVYPWGDDWDCTRCNNSVQPCKSNATTPVTAYESMNKGLLPFDVQDMAGNVWEWTLTEYATANSNDITNINARVLRGGSWLSGNSSLLRAANRNGSDPDNRLSDVGVRCALSF